MAEDKKTSRESQNREVYYGVNSDTRHSRVLVGTGQELVQYHSETATRIWFNDLSVDYDPHWHTALEIIMPVENWYDAVIGEDEFHLEPGDILFIPPGKLHHLHAPESGNRFVFLFDLSTVSRLHGFASIQPILSEPILLNRSTYPNVYDDIYQIFMQMRNEYFTQSDFADLTISSLLLNLLVKLASNHLSNIDLFSGIRVYKQKEYVQKFNSVMDYIDSHYTEDLNLDDIAKSIGFSKYHFSRLFKQYTNYTFCAYICHRRIKVAEELLEQPDLSITEVALQAGFPSISTFNRLFKQSNGCTPSEYREKNNYYKHRH